MANNLINESSPYLLQHANNPVNWHAWNDETLQLAKTQNKLILVSIGYSACHWCHVMEHESFEDENVAAVMNEHFINIKVDREERPDIDMVYMGAVQLMTGQGGWPLNCFALPDGRPIYGGTYFPKQQWVNILLNLAELFKNNPSKAYEYAAHLTDGLHQLEIPRAQEDFKAEPESLYKCVNRWKSGFDNDYGGPNKAPKFPLPNNYLFLLHYCHFEPNALIEKHVELTLTKMALGGIYDHLGGGFARYSTDLYWKVPHFEKMLYDNAQLITLYAQAYKQNPKPLYKQVVYETIQFVKRELTTSEFGFYSALDADTEGEEGKFYVWQKEELETLLGDDFALFADYYNINDTGYWEHDNYVLVRSGDDDIIAINHAISADVLHGKINTCKEKLFQEREKRSKPGVDTKVLAAWNGLMCAALAEAYLIFGEEEFKQLALANGTFLKINYLKPDGSLMRVINQNTAIKGFLDDYAFVCDAFMGLYTITADEDWLNKAHTLADYAVAHFYDSAQQTFFYTDDSGEKLIVRKAEWSDNVIPSSASQMAINLYKLSVYFEKNAYRELAAGLLKQVIPEIEHYGPGYSNWAMLLIQFIRPQTEVVIVGKSVNEKLKELYKKTPPNVIFALSDKHSDLPLVKNRYTDSTTIYVCHNNSCLLPTQSVQEALMQIGNYGT